MSDTAFIEHSARHLCVDLGESLCLFGASQVADHHDPPLVGLNPLLERAGRLSIRIELLPNVKDVRKGLFFFSISRS